MVVPRAASAYLPRWPARRAHGAFVAGCGHVGDGNVHLSVYLPDRRQAPRLLDELSPPASRPAGQVSGEHGIGLDKQRPYLALTDPALALSVGSRWSSTPGCSTRELLDTKKSNT